MRKLFLLAPDDDADAGGGAGDADKPAKPADSAAKTAKGTKTPREVALEKKVSTLEDENTDLVQKVQELTGIVDAAKKAPGRKNGKSILDDIFEFVGFTDGEPADKPAKKD